MGTKLMGFTIWHQIFNREDGLAVLNEQLFFVFYIVCGILRLYIQCGWDGLNNVTF